MLQNNNLYAPFCYKLKELSTFLFAIQTFGIKKSKTQQAKSQNNPFYAHKHVISNNNVRATDAPSQDLPRFSLSAQKNWP